MPDLRTGYYVAGLDQGYPIDSGIPLGELFEALDGITDDACEAAAATMRSDGDGEEQHQ